MAGLRAPDCRAGRRGRRDESLLNQLGRSVPSPARGEGAHRPCGESVTLYPSAAEAVYYSRVILSRSALPTTLTEDSAIAAAAMIGDSSSPNVG